MVSDHDNNEPMSPEETQQSLLDHAAAAALRARDALGGPLNEKNLAQFLDGKEGLRYPTAIEFEETSLESHQFAHPVFTEEEGQRRCVLQLRPKYAAHPSTHPLIVAYMAAAINYGFVADSALCERYGGTIMDMTEDAFYAAVCAIADM